MDTETEADLWAKSLGSLFVWRNVHDELANDTEECRKQQIQEDKACWRRSYVRSVFAYIEGNVYLLKRLTLIDFKIAEISLNSAEVAFLLEESYHLSDNGTVNTKPHYGVKIGSNIRFLFHIISEKYGINNELDVSTGVWNTFQNALKVRNRINHPKDAGDIKVSDQDIKDAVHTFEWFKASVNKLVEDATHGHHAILTKKRESMY